MIGLSALRPVNWVRSLALAGLASMLMLAPAAAQQSVVNTAGDPGLERADDHATGALDAPLTIIEYASFACPHCANFQRDVWPMIERDFIETGEVRYIVRPMLTAPPQIAALGIVLGECAADDRYFTVTDLLFIEQENIFRTAQAGGDVAAIYYQIGAAVGLSQDDILACVADPQLNERVTYLAEQAQRDGVRSTPNFFIAGQQLTVEQQADGNYFAWGGETLLIDGERVTGRLNEDSFRRIILHFLGASDSGE